MRVTQHIGNALRNVFRFPGDRQLMHQRDLAISAYAKSCESRKRAIAEFISAMRHIKPERGNEAQPRLPF